MDFNLMLKEIIIKIVDYLTGFIGDMIMSFFTTLTGKEPVD
ncbi:MAG TPA: hypothetical protein PLX23_11920 [Candidatus Hydrogenedens sp.]|nr:hypothetical protein [Candidatus Hydrogenedens sp.]